MSHQITTASEKPSPGRSIQGILHAAADLIFPRSCVHCGDCVEGSSYLYLCRSCAQELHIITPPACSTCGFPFWGQLAGPQSCPHCAELNPLFSEGKALFLAKGPGRSLLHQLKYQAGFYVLRDIEKMLSHAAHYRAYLAESILVPVPLHPTKERERGYNQSLKIAALLAASAQPGTSVQCCLQRTEYTQTQTRLNRSQRHQNVKNAFALAPNTVLNSQNQYILVDDVFTTGSTLNACARVLLDHGAAHIKVATLGHG